MPITKDAVRELYSRYAELEQAGVDATELLNVAKGKGEDKEIRITRGGETHMVKEAHLWKEVQQVGYESVAGEALSKRYPEVFAAYDRHNQLAEELRDFTIQAFGIDYQKLRMVDIVKLFETLYDYRSQEPGQVVRVTFWERLRWLFTGK